MRNHFTRFLPVVSLVAACGAFTGPEISVNGKDGIPKIDGTTTVDIPTDFKCGNPITDPNKKYTVTTTVEGTDCRFTFKQDVTFKADEYKDRPEIVGVQAVKRVEIDVNKLKITDASTGTAVDLNARVKALSGKVFGVEILTKADLTTATPFTKKIDNTVLATIKADILAKKDLVIPADVSVVIDMATALPAKLGIEFDAQPSIVIGA